MLLAIHYYLILLLPQIRANKPSHSEAIDKASWLKCHIRKVITCSKYFHFVPILESSGSCLDLWSELWSPACINHRGSYNTLSILQVCSLPSMYIPTARDELFGKYFIYFVVNTNWPPRSICCPGTRASPSENLANIHFFSIYSKIDSSYTTGTLKILAD